MSALLDRDLARASTEAGVALTDYFVTDEACWLWRIRVDQVAADPASADWIARAAVAEPEGIVVGHAGFHGPPDEAGMVEIAYSVDPAHRRRGIPAPCSPNRLPRPPPSPTAGPDGRRSVPATRPPLPRPQDGRANGRTPGPCQKSGSRLLL